MQVDPRLRRIEVQDQRELVAVTKELFADGATALPVGFGSRLGLGANPGQLTALLSLRGMAGILRLDKKDLCCSVAAGTSLEQFLAAIAEAGLAFAPGPFQGQEERSVGGILGEAAKSPRGFDRSELRAQVLGIAAVDGRGRSFKAGGRVVKNVAGYDVSRFFVGSGGAYFVACSFELRLVVRPELCAVYSSQPRSRVEALLLWQALRAKQHDASSLDILLETGGSARVRLMLAGRASLLARLGKPQELTLEKEDPLLWDESSPAQETATSLCRLRGMLPISDLAGFLGSMPDDAVGQIHMQGAFSLGVAKPSSLLFPQRSIVRCISAPDEGESMPAGFRSSEAVWTAYARRLKQNFGGNLAPARLAFDCAMDERV